MTNEEMEQLKNLQEQIADLKAEIAKLNAQNGNDAFTESRLKIAT